MWYLVGLAVYVGLAALGYLFIRGARVPDERIEEIYRNYEIEKALHPLPSARKQGVISYSGRPDLVLLRSGASEEIHDPDTVKASASIERPYEFAEGIRRAIVKG